MVSRPCPIQPSRVFLFPFPTLVRSSRVTSSTSFPFVFVVTTDLPTPLIWWLIPLFHPAVLTLFVNEIDIEKLKRPLRWPFYFQRAHRPVISLVAIRLFRPAISCFLPRNSPGNLVIWFRPFSPGRRRIWSVSGAAGIIIRERARRLSARTKRIRLIADAKNASNFPFYLMSFQLSA